MWYLRVVVFVRPCMDVINLMNLFVQLERGICSLAEYDKFANCIIVILCWYIFIFILTAIFSGGPGLADTKNVSIPDFIGAKDDGGGEWWQLEL